MREQAVKLVAMALAAPFIFVAAVWRAFCEIIFRRGREEPASMVLLHQTLASMQLNMQESISRVQQTLQTQVNGLDERVSHRLSSMDTSMRETMGGATATMKKVGEDLGELRGAARRMVEEGQKVSGLIEVMGKPTFRGGFGEFLLDRLLGQVLPSGSYSMPHSFKSGLRVDAAIFLEDRIVPVDAKFPMESFQRLAASADGEDQRRLRREFATVVKGHMDAITKYILPDEGTFDFALMYIPAENVYYEVILKDGLLPGESLADYALAKRVVPVSPNSFYLYLMSVAMGLHGYRMEQNARYVLDNLNRIAGEFDSLREDFGTLGRHISHADSKWREVDRQAERLARRLQEQRSLPEEPERLLVPTQPEP